MVAVYAFWLIPTLRLINRYKSTHNSLIVMDYRPNVVIFGALTVLLRGMPILALLT